MKNLLKNLENPPKFSFPNFEEKWIVNTCENLEIEALNYFEKYKNGEYSFTEVKKYFSNLLREEFFTLQKNKVIAQYMEFNELTKEIAQKYSDPNINQDKRIQEYIDSLMDDPLYRAFKRLFLEPLKNKLFQKEGIDEEKQREIKKQKIQTSNDTLCNKIFDFVDFLDTAFRDEYLFALKQAGVEYRLSNK